MQILATKPVMSGMSQLNLAEEVAKIEYGIQHSDWIQINDPLPNCQHDFIRPVRVPGREKGNPQWGSLEELRDGKWVPFKIPKS